MAKRSDSSSSQNEVTRTFHGDTAKPKQPVRDYFLIKAFAIGALLSACMLAIGVLAGHYAYPRQVFVEKVVPMPAPVAKPAKEVVFLPPPDLEQEVEKRAEERLAFVLQNFRGVLIVKDHEALTVRYKKAAAGNKDGFWDLKKGVSYPLYGYVHYKECGYGLVNDLQRGIFLLKLESGVTKAPVTSPGTLMVPSGIRVELGTAK